MVLDGQSLHCERWILHFCMVVCWIQCGCMIFMPNNEKNASFGCNQMNTYEWLQ